MGWIERGKACVGVQPGDVGIGGDKKERSAIYNEAA